MYNKILRYPQKVHLFYALESKVISMIDEVAKNGNFIYSYLSTEFRE